MKGLPREYLAFVERVLREHPARMDELERLDEVIEAYCRPSAIGAAGGAGTVSEPEKILLAKENNLEYQKLWRRVETVKRAIDSLNEEKRTIIEMFFWDGMRIRQIAEVLHMDKSTVWRTKTRALKKISPFVIGLWA